LGGAQRYVLLLARAFSKRAEVAIALGPDGNGWLSAEAEKHGIKTFKLPHLRRAIRPLGDLRAIFELRALLKKNNWDILHANSSKAGVVMALASRLANPAPAKTFYTAHGWVFEEKLPFPIKRFYLFLEWLGSRGRTGTIVLSKKEKTIALEKLGIASGQIHLIPHGLSERDAPKFLNREEARRELGISAGAFLLGTIANFYPTKALDVLIQYANEPELRQKNFEMAIIGDGPERKKLEDMIEASAEKDRFKLFFTIPDAGRLLRAFDIFVLPSRKEGLPFVILESLLAGLPIIATDVGGVKEAVGDAGIIVPPDDSSALAQALAEAIENENLREQLAENSRLRAAEIIRQGELMIEKTWTAYGL